jgi:hypothetical protein
MRVTKWSPLGTIFEAISTTVGWMFVIAGTSVFGFCCGYWIGHEGNVGAIQIAQAMAWVPVVWLGQPLVFIPYFVTALALYLGIRLESPLLRFSALPITFFTWLVVVATIVVQTSHNKFWQW